MAKPKPGKATITLTDDEEHSFLLHVHYDPPIKEGEGTLAQQVAQQLCSLLTEDRKPTFEVLAEEDFDGEIPRGEN